MTRRGFPHSDIPGSKLVCSSPRLFAAYRVLHRLLAPRHSPCALSSLTIGIQELTIGRFFALKRTRQSLFLNPHLEHTAVFVDRKNYRLQDIQLSKIIRGASLRRTPQLVRSRGPLWTPLRSRGRLAFARRLGPRRPKTLDRPLAGPSSGRRLVENTGLEPVTSWLQTRRSPS
jgi:hypothetical protein